MSALHEAGAGRAAELSDALVPRTPQEELPMSATSLHVTAHELEAMLADALSNGFARLAAHRAQVEAEQRGLRERAVDTWMWAVGS
jgi:hypothetical protein